MLLRGAWGRWGGQAQQGWGVRGVPFTVQQVSAVFLQTTPEGVCATSVQPRLHSMLFGTSFLATRHKLICNF